MHIWQKPITTVECTEAKTLKFRGDEEYYLKELMSKEFWSLLLVLDLYENYDQDNWKKMVVVKSQEYLFRAYDE